MSILDIFTWISVKAMVLTTKRIRWKAFDTALTVILNVHHLTEKLTLSFTDRNTCFKAVLAETKRIGKGDVEHYHIISKADLKTLYTSTHLSINTHQGLLNKVQFDVRMFFCRRGNENMHGMTKETFKVFIDENTGRKYVQKVVDEATKNHRLDKESSSGIMPKVPGSIYCPVLSYEMYVSKLHPACMKLWQRPLDSFLDSEPVWYCSSPVGEKKLSTFLSALSKSANLSKIYTNHSIRATSALILSKCMYGPSQVMAVTGHKSVQSLSVYQRVSDEEKIKMGESLTENVLPTIGLPALPSSEKRAIMPNSEKRAIMPTSSSVQALREIQNYELSGVDMQQLFDDFDSEITCTQRQVQQSVYASKSACIFSQLFCHHKQLNNKSKVKKVRNCTVYSYVCC